MHMGVLFACVYAPHVCLVAVEVRIGYPRAGVKDDCDLPRGWWEQNPGPPQEHQVLLPAEPALEPIHFKMISRIWQ